MKKPSPTSFYFNHLILKSQRYKSERFKIINSVIDSGTYFFGKQTSILSQNLSSYLGGGYLTLTASGHDALALALAALKLSSNDEIIFPVNSYPTAFPVCMSKSKPVPVDVDENGQLSSAELKSKITKNTKAIVLVHLYGLTVDIDKIVEIIKGKTIILIEDCAQAFGTTYKGKPVGAFGDISCFSFYPTKNLATLGDGGAIWTKHKKYHKYFESAKSYGEEKRYFSQFLSGHSRIPEIQAGILNLYFKRSARDFKKRKDIAMMLKEQIETQKLTKFVRILKSNPNSNPVQHLFVIEVENRDKLKKYLAKQRIETYIHYPYPIHLLPAFSYLGYKEGSFSMAERLSKNILSLPFHPFMTKNQIKKVVKILKEFYG